MNNLWILPAISPADAEQEEGMVITSEEVERQTTESTTQADGSQSPDAGEGVPTKTPTSPLLQYLPFILLFVLMYMLLFRGPKKKQREHQKMVQSLSKNDKVQTIGGIMGTVIDVKDNEIVLKVDESNNTKIRVIPGAIRTVHSNESD